MLHVGMYSPLQWEQHWSPTGMFHLKAALDLIERENVIFGEHTVFFVALNGAIPRMND